MQAGCCGDDTTGRALGFNAPVNLAAYDRDGDSIELGPPVKFEVDGLLQPDVIAEEPPKHLDWLPDKTTPGLAKGWMRISRTPDFFVQLSNSDKTEYKSSNTTKSGYSLGGSVEAEGKIEGSFGFKALGPNGKIEIEDKLGVGYQYDKSKEALESDSTEYEQSTDESTTDDDFVAYSAKTLFFFRYPIINFPQQKADDGSMAKPYVQVMLPSRTLKYGFTNGKGVAGYDPQHENGNVLSYPGLVNKVVDIEDLGSFTPRPPPNGQTCAQSGDKPDPNAPPPASTPLFNENYGVDPNKGTNEYAFTTVAASSCSIDSSHKLSEDFEFKAGFTLGEGEGVAEESGSASIDVKANADQTWASTSDQETTTSTTKKFSIGHEAPVPGSQAYKAATAYYYSDSGTQKVKEAVDLSAGDFWASVYGDPDPALNMPLKIDMLPNPTTGVLDYPNWNEFGDRQKIRGFELTHSPDAPNPQERGAPFASNPVDGDDVRIQVPVYNYMVDYNNVKPKPNVTVEVQALAMEGLTGDELADEPPIPIGNIPSGPLKPAGSGPNLVTLDWNTKGHGPETNSEKVTGKRYRIFVTLDPDDKIKDETHELMDRYGTAPAHVDPAREDSAVLEDPKTGHPEKLEIGQNNQGWGEVVIDNKEATPPPLAKAARAKPSGGSSPFSVATAQAAESDEQTGGLGLALGDGALAVETPKGKYVSDDAQAEVGRPVRIRARLSSDHDTGRNETVILMDGDRVIGTQVVRGVPDDGGGEAEFRWIPTKKGEHRLEVRTAAAIGVKDNSEPLDVDVVPVGEVEEPGGGDGLWWKILLGVVLLGGVAGAVVAVRRRSNTPTTG